MCALGSHLFHQYDVVQREHALSRMRRIHVRWPGNCPESSSCSCHSLYTLAAFCQASLFDYQKKKTSNWRTCKSNSKSSLKKNSLFFFLLKLLYENQCNLVLGILCSTFLYLPSIIRDIIDYNICINSYYTLQEREVNQEILSIEELKLKNRFSFIII